MSYEHYDQAKKHLATANNLDAKSALTWQGKRHLDVAQIEALLAIFDALKNIEGALKGER